MNCFRQHLQARALRVKLPSQIHYFCKLHAPSSGKPEANDLVKGTGSLHGSHFHVEQAQCSFSCCAADCPGARPHSPAGWKVWTEDSSSSLLALYWKPLREQRMPGTQMSLEITPETSTNTHKPVIDGNTMKPLLESLWDILTL